MKQQILDRIASRESVIGIVGLGYVGLPLAKEFLKAGFSVLGLDIDEEKVKKIKKAESYIKHIAGDFMREYVLEKKKLDATSDFARIKEVDFILICVPTPLDDHYNPDLSYVRNTSLSIALNLKKGHTVVLESTTYPGTTEEEIQPIFEGTKMKVGEDIFLGYSPEREDPGNRDFNTGTIPKVISAITPTGLEIIDALYSQIVKTVPVSDTKVAEASKILENTYRAVNIALVNELKTIFDRMGIDIWGVIEAAKTKPFGFSAFYPGPGLGGHCIPIDPFYLTYKAREVDLFSRFIELSGQVNNMMPNYVVEGVMNALNQHKKWLNGSKILILGLAYKANIDDDRESPSIKIMSLLKDKGADLHYYDPYVPHRGPLRKYPDFELSSIEYSKEAIKEYDLVLLLTDHDAFPYDEILENAQIIVDTRNRFPKHEKVFKA